MAGFALLTERTAMTIIRAMTAVARAARNAIFFALLMAARASKIGVLAFEFKISAGVIEGVAIETENVGTATFVIGVALLACQRGLMLELAVKAALIGDIGGDDIVALHAQLILRLLGERGVALAAIVFQFRVRLDQFTRHQQCFEIHIVGIREHRAQIQQKKNSAAKNVSRLIVNVICAHRFVAFLTWHPTCFDAGLIKNFHSIQVHCVDVNQSRNNEHEKYRHVQHVPQ